MKIKSHLLLVLLAVLSLQAQAFTIVGKLTDEAGQVMPYVNVYLKEQVQNGTISDLQGLFQLDNIDQGQTLVVSFIGYKTLYFRLNTEPRDTLRIVMTEQPIMLEEAWVGVAKKQSHRKQMKQMIAAVRSQLKRDFPDSVAVRYNINSDYGVYNQSEVIALETLGGNLVEVPGYAAEQNDLIQLKINWIRRYRDTHTQQNYLRLDTTLKKDMNSKLIHYADSSRWVHKFLWGSGIKQGFEQFASSPTRWEIDERDTVTVFTYTESRNYLGIVKGKLVLSYYLDPYTYRVRKVAQDFVTDVDIPFGYKLSKEQIQMLNTLLIGVSFDKYRVKRAHIDIKRNILYASYSNGRIGVLEKNVISNIRIEDRKANKPVYFKQTGSIKVNTASFGVKPYGQADEMSTYPLILKQKPE